MRNGSNEVQNHFRAPNLELTGLGCGHMVVVLNTWHRPSYLHRAWCLYEPLFVSRKPQTCQILTLC